MRFEGLARAAFDNCDKWGDPWVVILFDDGLSCKMCTFIHTGYLGLWKTQINQNGRTRKGTPLLFISLTCHYWFQCNSLA